MPCRQAARARCNAWSAMASRRRAVIPDRRWWGGPAAPTPSGGGASGSRSVATPSPRLRSPSPSAVSPGPGAASIGSFLAGTAPAGGAGSTTTPPRSGRTRRRARFRPPSGGGTDDRNALGRAPGVPTAGEEHDAVVFDQLTSAPGAPSPLRRTRMVAWQRAATSSRPAPPRRPPPFCPWCTLPERAAWRRQARSSTSATSRSSRAPRAGLPTVAEAAGGRRRA